MAANEDLLGSLHQMTAAAFIEQIKGQPILGEDGEVIGYIPPSAATMQAITKFLKDNAITCAPSESNEIGELERSLAEKQKRRASRLTPQDLQDATEQSGQRRLAPGLLLCPFGGQ